MQKIIFTILLSVALCSATVSNDCLSALQELEPYAREALADVREHDYEAVLEVALEARDVLAEVYEQCVGGRVSYEQLSSSSCTDALVALLPDLERLYEDVESQNYAQLIQDLLTSVSGVEEAAEACGLEYKTVTWDDCYKAAENLEPIVKVLYNDITNKLPSQFQADILSFASQIKEAKHECFTEEAPKERKLQSQTCINDLISLLPQLQSLVDDAETKNYLQLAEDILKTITPLEQAYEDCFGSMKLARQQYFPEEAPKERKLQSQTCINDLLAVLPDLQNLVSDAESKDYFKLAEDVLKTITPLEKAYDACIGAMSLGNNEECIGEVKGLIEPLDICLHDAVNDDTNDLQNDILNYTPQIIAAYDACYRYNQAEL